MSEGNPYFGATFAERKAARLGASAKPAAEPKAIKADEVEVEDKAVTPKKPARTTEKKS
jgi:hypothetical protein